MIYVYNFTPSTATTKFVVFCAFFLCVLCVLRATSHTATHTHTATHCNKTARSCCTLHKYTRTWYTRIEYIYTLTYHICAHINPLNSNIKIVRAAHTLYEYTRTTGWRRPIWCLIFIGHFSQKNPTICGSFAKNDLHLKASYGSLPPYNMSCTSYVHTIYIYIYTHIAHVCINTSSTATTKLCALGTHYVNTQCVYSYRVYRVFVSCVPYTRYIIHTVHTIQIHTYHMYLYNVYKIARSRSTLKRNNPRSWHTLNQYTVCLFI